MSQNKMRGRNGYYNENVTYQIGNIPEPTDDSVTISSFDNSQMTYSKSQNQSKKSTTRMKRRNQQYEQERENEGPQDEYGDQTMSYQSINSSTLNMNDSREEEKNINSPNFRGNSHSPCNRNQDKTLPLDISQNQNDFGKRFYPNQEELTYRDDNNKSIRCEDGLFDDTTSNNERQPIQFTRTSGFNHNTVTSGFNHNTVTSDFMTSLEGEDSLENGESEPDLSQSLRECNESYATSEVRHSLEGHEQYQHNRDMSRSQDRSSFGGNTYEQRKKNDSRFDDYEGEYYPEDEEEESENYQSRNFESQISGMESLTQTHQTKVSSNKFRNDTSLHSRSQIHNQTYSSKFNDTDNSCQYPNESIRVRTRNERNNETVSYANSNTSWWAETPEEAKIAPRTTKDNDNCQFEYAKSPAGKSLLLDESVINDKPGMKISQGTNQLDGSNLQNDSDLFNSRTVTRSKRLQKGIGNIQGDQQLMEALDENEQQESQNHIVLDRGYEDKFLDNSYQNQERTGNHQSNDYRKLAYENRKLKEKVAKLTSSVNSKKSLLERSESKLEDINQKLIDEENLRQQIEDEFHQLKDRTRGVNDMKIKGLNSEKLKRARNEVKNLKKQNLQSEKEVEFFRQKISKMSDMDQYYNTEISRLQREVETFKIKEKRFRQQEDQIHQFAKEKEELFQQRDEIMERAHSEIHHLQETIQSQQNEIRLRDQDIENLSKNIQDNQHLLTADQNNYKQHLAEIDDLKQQLEEVTKELEEYKMHSANNPLGNRIDVHKELQDQQHTFNNRIQSVHQQADKWKKMFEKSEKKWNSFQKQIHNLERNLSARSQNSGIAEDQANINQTIDRLKDMFSFNEEEDVFNELEKVKVDLDNIDLIKEDYKKNEQMYADLKQKYDDVVKNLHNQGASQYTESLLQDQSQKIEEMEKQIHELDKRRDQAENAAWDRQHEKNLKEGEVNDIKRILKDRENEIQKLKNVNRELKSNLDNDAARKLILEKKELEARIQELEKNNEFEMSRSSKDLDYLRKDASSLVSFILTLEFAHDKDFDELFQNQSHSNEFEHAKKYLENQKDIVSSQFGRLNKELNSQLRQIEKYQQQISEIEEKAEDTEAYKKESLKWKQSYERLVGTLKNTQGNDNQEMDQILQDNEELQKEIEDLENEKEEIIGKVQEKEGFINDLQNMIRNNEKEIKSLSKTIENLTKEAQTESKFVNKQNSTLLLKLEKDIKKLESENSQLKFELENSKKSFENLNEKYQVSVEKSLKHDQLEYSMKNLQKENDSLQNQVMILKKADCEQKRLLSANDPANVMATLNNLKATLQKKENIIQEQKAQLDVLQNLLDEARIEMANGEEKPETQEIATMNDALEILDSIISKPWGISMSNKTQEFNTIMKRVQLIREQSEEPILRRMVKFMQEYLPEEFNDLDQSSESVTTLKQAFCETLTALKDQNKHLCDISSQSLNSSMEGKHMKRSYGVKDTDIDILYIFDHFAETYRILRTCEFEKSMEKQVNELRQKYNEDLTSTSNEFIEKLQVEKINIVSQMNAEKEAELKIREGKIRQDFEAKRKQMAEEFENLKKEFQEQFDEQKNQFRNVSEQDNNQKMKEIEQLKEVAERELQEKLQKLKNYQEGTFNNRISELEDEFNLKKQRLEFEMKSKAETKDNKNKLELETLVSKFEKQAEERIKRIQNESDMKVQEMEEQVSQKNADMKKLKTEHEKKLKEHKKIMERDLKFRSETQERECKSKFERELKKQKESEEELQEKINDLEQKITEEKKKQRELLKSNNEKHKAEVRNIKNNHQNELVRKKIETEKEIQKAKRDLELEIENTKKEFELKIAEKLMTQKKELNSANSQKLKIERTNKEKALIDKETELNKIFSQKEIEIIEKHQNEMNELKDNLTQQHERLLKITVENMSEEYKEQIQYKVEEELQDQTKKIQMQYQTETHNLKLKLQEMSEVQSMQSEGNHTGFVGREESIQTDRVLFPANASEEKKMHGVSVPFDYQKAREYEKKIFDNQEEDDDFEQPRKPPTARSMIHARNDKEIIEIMKSKNQKDMSHLQIKYEEKIFQLIQNHHNQLKELKSKSIVETVWKLGKILILELEKFNQSMLCKTKQEALEKSESKNLEINDLIADITEDKSTYKILEKIKKKLNEVLTNYKKKVDKRQKVLFEQEILKLQNKLQSEFDQKLKEIEMRNYDSPSFLDIGTEHNSPEKRVRPSVSNKKFADFTKEFKVWNKNAYDKNIITKVCPPEQNKSIIVDLNRIVSDLSMIKNSFFAVARQLGFELVEPHKTDIDDHQEQNDPNIPEIVYSVSQEYRHLLNTFLRFSRDLVINLNNEEDTQCFKLHNNSVQIQKEEVMKYKLEISDLKEKLIKLDKEQNLLQAIYQDHLDSRLQIIDFNDYDNIGMNEFSKDWKMRIKKHYKELMNLQTIFLKNLSSTEGLNYDCKVYVKENEINFGEVSYNNIEFDTSWPQERFDKLKRNTFEHKSRNEFSRHENGLRKSVEINTYTAQIPRKTIGSGRSTSRSVYISPKRSRDGSRWKNKEFTESTKAQLLQASENIQSTAKPPKFRSNICPRKSPNDSIIMKSRNHYQERHNSLENIQFNDLKERAQPASKLSSTQSLNDLAKFGGAHSLRKRSNSIAKVKEDMNWAFKRFREGNLGQL